MGRGKVEVKRIENKINRQVTFAKRRSGLLKKAYELSVLCDADLALIIFSNRGNLYDFCNTSNMAKSIERYRKCVYGAMEANQPAGMQGKYEDYLKLKSKVEEMQRSQRHFLGEDLGELGAEDLNIIEHQLDSSLNRIRSTREEVLLETNRELRRKEKNFSPVLLGEATTSFQLSWGAQNHDFHNNRSSPQPEAFFEPLPCNNNSVHLRYNSIGTPEETATTSTRLGFTPYWML